MRNVRLRPLKFAGAAFFFPHMLGLVCLVAAVLCAPAQASVDMVDLFAPGDPTDVLAAGLVLPGQFALAPDVARPASLLEFPDSATARLQQSCPLNQHGADPRCLSAQALSATVNVRRTMRGLTLAGAGVICVSPMRFTEEGIERSHVDATPDNAGLAGAVEWRKTRLCLSYSGTKQPMNATSTRLSGIETNAGGGIGFLDADLNQRELTGEFTRDFSDYRFGLLASRSGGSLDLRTVAVGQGYSAIGDTDGWRLAPYVIRHRGSGTNMLLFNASDQSVDGPVYIGKIYAGAWSGNWRSASAAIARMVDVTRGRRLYSLQVSSADINLGGQAGGFLLPGLFDSVYYTRNSASLRQITARYGVEKYHGSTTARRSIMLAYCDPSASTYSTKAEFLRPVKVISDARMRDESLILLAPSLGAGYRKGAWRMDIGATLYGGIVLNRIRKAAAAQPTTAKRSNGTLPGYRIGITIRHDF